jgi:hypothetical protein
MQGLSNYYKKNYHDLKKHILKIFQEYYKNILRIFPQK